MSAMVDNLQVTHRPELNFGDFKFNEEREAQAKKILARYPAGREASAIIPFLDLAQRENGGWLSKEAIDYVAYRTGSVRLWDPRFCWAFWWASSWLPVPFF